jgi:hypothetical protein
MWKHVLISTDLKTAAVLAGFTGLLGAITVPVLLPSVFELVPPDQRTLPLPLPLFCMVLAVQILVIYGLLALAGLTEDRIPRLKKLVADQEGESALALTRYQRHTTTRWRPFP